jgi:polysaccharide biosynthesis/export protein
VFAALSNFTAMRYLLYLFLLCSGFSCVSHKQLVNFQTASFPAQAEAITNELDLLIQPEDLLQITIESALPEAIRPFVPSAGGQNNPMMMMQQGQMGGNAAEMFMGYFVDRMGMIELPTAGKIKAAGMTISQLQDTIGRLVRASVNDASINVRFLNFKVSMIGELNNPGILRLSNKRVTILEALALAGDLTPYADRKDILVIREKNGERHYGHLDLRSSSIFQSPFFYLEQNDVVYARPTRAKVGAVQDQSNRFLTFGSAGLSLVTLVITIINLNNKDTP